MKKKLFVLLSLMMVLPLVACGGGSIAGTYTLVEMSFGGMKYDATAIKEGGMTQELVLKEDGTGTLAVEGEESDTFTWKDGKITMEGDTQTTTYEAKGNTITISTNAGGEGEGMMVMVFKKK